MTGLVRWAGGAAVVLAATAVLGGAAGGATTGAAATKTVSVQDNYFSPKTTRIKSGDRVRFEWSRAENPHDVKFTKVPSGATKPRTCSLRTSGACRRRFGKPGTYRYVCTIHLASDDMRGKVVVERG